MSRLFRKSERRSISYQDVWGNGSDTSTLTGSSMQSALRLIPVYAATSLIGDLVSTLPRHGYHDPTDGVRQRLPVQPDLVTDPSVFGGRIAWTHQGLASLLLRGRTTGVILDLDSRGIPSKIAWQHPDAVQIDESTSLPKFTIHGRPLPLSSLVHIPAYVLPGSICGLSVIQMFRMQIEAGLQAQRFGLAWYQNTVAPAAHVRNNAQTVSPKEARTLKDLFRATVASGDIWVTGSDWEYTSLTVSPADAQFLEQIKATATQIAAVFRLPPEDIGGTSGASLTYATLEQNDLKVARRALLPWTARFEEALSALMPAGEYIKFNLDAFSRADLKTRMEAHEIATRIGVETNDEARALEERPPLTDDEIKKWQTLYGPRTGAVQGTGPTGRMEHT